MKVASKLLNFKTSKAIILIIFLCAKKREVRRSLAVSWVWIKIPVFEISGNSSGHDWHPKGHWVVLKIWWRMWWRFALKNCNGLGQSPQFLKLGSYCSIKLLKITRLWIIMKLKYRLFAKIFIFSLNIFFSVLYVGDFLVDLFWLLGDVIKRKKPLSSDAKADAVKWIIFVVSAGDSPLAWGQIGVSSGIK